jgi:hypothetical protein
LQSELGNNGIAAYLILGSGGEKICGGRILEFHPAGVEAEVIRAYLLHGAKGLPPGGHIIRVHTCFDFRRSER